MDQLHSLMALFIKVPYHQILSKVKESLRKLMDFNTMAILERICLMVWDKFIKRMDLRIRDILRMDLRKEKVIISSLSKELKNFNILEILFKASLMELVY